MSSVYCVFTKCVRKTLFIVTDFMHFVFVLLCYKNSLLDYVQSKCIRTHLSYVNSINIECDIYDHKLEF